MPDHFIDQNGKPYIPIPKRKLTATAAINGYHDKDYERLRGNQSTYLISIHCQCGRRGTLKMALGQSLSRMACADCGKVGTMTRNS